MIFKRSVLLVLVILLCASCGYRESYKIGALFDKTNFRQEQALQVAVQDISNKYDFRLWPVVEEIEEDNPFQAMQSTCKLLKNEVIGVIGPFTEDNANVVQSILDAKEIPHMEVRWEDYPQNGTVINLHPFPDTLTRTYFDVIKAWEWENFIILYENNESLQRVGELVKLLELSEHIIVLKQLDTKKFQNNFRPILKEIWRSGATHFILDCSLEILPDVLQQAQQIGLMTNKQSYIITNLDAHTIDLTPYLYSETNITFMRFLNPENENLQVIAARIHDADEGFELEAGFHLKLQEALIYDAVMMFAEAVDSYRDLIEPKMIDCDGFEDSFTAGTSIVNKMKSLYHEGLTGNVTFGITGFRSEFALDILELKEGGETIIGDWNSSRICGHPVCPLHIIRDVKEVPEETDILNRTFIVMITLTEPFGMRVESQKPLTGNAQYEGFAVDMVEELSRMLGFNYTLRLREDKKNGEKLSNGQWTGIIGDIMSGSVDLAVTDLTITMEREAAVDFTSPFMMLGISILYQKPTKAPPSFFSFADPFAFEVWRLLMSAWIGIALILFILGRISPSEWENPYPCVEEPEFLVNQLDLRNCFWFVTGSIMQQGSEIELKSVSTRMVAGMWWFFTLLMVSSYTANLAAFLTTENPDPHFTNFKELVANAEEKGIKYGAKSGGATAKFFEDKAKNDSHSDFAKAWEHMTKYKKEVIVGENQDGVEKAQRERYALFMESTSIEYEVQRKCDLNQVGSNLDEKGYGLAMRKNSSYRSALINAILHMQQSGKIADIKRKWWEERKGGGQCSKDGESSEATPLNLKGVEGVFWVSIGGVIVAFFSAIFETIINASKKAIRTKTPISSVLFEELRFYFRFSETVKQVTYPEDSQHASSSREKELPTYGWAPRISVENFPERRSRSRSRRSRSKRSRRSKSKRGSTDSH